MKRITLVIATLFVAFLLNAKITLPAVISDGMVLQQNTTVRLWGKTKPSTLIKITAEWSKSVVETMSTKDGVWLVELKTVGAGGPYTIRISDNEETIILKDILLGEVWLCAGQSNMSMPVKGFVSQPITGSLDAIVESSKYSNIRMFTVTRNTSLEKEFDVKGGNWQTAGINTTKNFSAIGYFFALELCNALQVPVGMINVSWGGSSIQAWMGEDVLKMFPEVDLSNRDLNSKTPNRVPTLLYNAMFNPIAKYAMKGIIWYQGETNIPDYKLYAKLFPAMVKEWRENIDRSDIPFYYVQIAPYKYDDSNNSDGAFLREVQFNSQYVIPNSGMVTTGDVGDENLIHPANKKNVSKRLSYWALAKTYGFNELPYRTAIYRDKSIEKNTIIINFDLAEEGLILNGDSRSAFEIAGEDNVFFPAEAKVNKDGKSISVVSEKVSNPRHVRYCFKNYAASVLYNNYMIPVSPFRTDSLEK